MTDNEPPHVDPKWWPFRHFPHVETLLFVGFLLFMIWAARP